MIDRETAAVEIRDIKPFLNDSYIGFVIQWEGTMGFGEYTIYRNATGGEWKGESEYMDSNNDKWFLQMLLDDLLEKVKIEH